MANWKECMLAPVRTLVLGGRIVFGSGTECALDGNAVFSLSIEEGAGGAISPGDVLSASCTLDLVNDAGQWLSGGSCLGMNELVGATLMPELGVYDGAEVLWRPLGVFQVESAVHRESEGIMRLQGQDSIGRELAEPFLDELSYPQTLRGLWLYALAQTRYVWSGDVPNGSALVDSKPDWQDASLRTALGYIAAAAGCFVRVDRAGSLELCRLWNGAEAVRAPDPGCYMKLERGGCSYGPVDALRLNCGDGEERVYLSGEDSALHVVQISENPLYAAESENLDALAQGTLDVLAGFSTDEFSLEWRGDPELRIGDRLDVLDLDGTVCSGVVSRQTLRFGKGFSAGCVCAVPEDNNSGVRRAITPEGGLNAAALTGALNGKLLSVGSVTAGKLAAGSVTAEKLAAGAVDAGALEAVTAKIESLAASDIDADRLAAALAAFTVVSAGTADFDFATVQHLVSRALNLEKGVGERMYIRNLAVEFAQLLSARVSGLCIQASDGLYYTLDVDENGLVVASAAEPSESEIAAGQTGSGRVILAADVTAENMNTSSLLASCALINRIDAARIDVDQLFAREAFIGLLRSCRIVGEKSITMIAGAAEELGNVVRLQEDGLHVGVPDGSGEVLIDSESVNVRMNGRKFSSFAGNYVEFGNYQLRRTADGGLAFKMR